MDKYQTAINNASFVYSINMLRMLLQMNLISEQEYNKIVAVSAEYYGVEVFCV